MAVSTQVAMIGSEEEVRLLLKRMCRESAAGAVLSLVLPVIGLFILDPVSLVAAIAICCAILQSHTYFQLYRVRSNVAQRRAKDRADKESVASGDGGE